MLRSLGAELGGDSKLRSRGGLAMVGENDEMELWSVHDVVQMARYDMEHLERVYEAVAYFRLRRDGLLGRRRDGLTIYHLITPEVFVSDEVILAGSDFAPSKPGSEHGGESSMGKAQLENSKLNNSRDQSNGRNNTDCNQVTGEDNISPYIALIQQRQSIPTRTEVSQNTDKVTSDTQPENHVQLTENHLLAVPSVGQQWHGGNPSYDHRFSDDFKALLVRMDEFQSRQKAMDKIDAGVDVYYLDENMDESGDTERLSDDMYARDDMSMSGSELPAERREVESLRYSSGGEISAEDGDFDDHADVMQVDVSDEDSLEQVSEELNEVTDSQHSEADPDDIGLDHLSDIVPEDSSSDEDPTIQPETPARATLTFRRNGLPDTRTIRYDTNGQEIQYSAERHRAPGSAAEEAAIARGFTWTSPHFRHMIRPDVNAGLTWSSPAFQFGPRTGIDEWVVEDHQAIFWQGQYSRSVVGALNKLFTRYRVLYDRFNTEVAEVMEDDEGEDDEDADVEEYSRSSSEDEWSTDDERPEGPIPPFVPRPRTMGSDRSTESGEYDPHAENRPRSNEARRYESQDLGIETLQVESD